MPDDRAKHALGRNRAEPPAVDAILMCPHHKQLIFIWIGLLNLLDHRAKDRMIEDNHVPWLGELVKKEGDFGNNHKISLLKRWTQAVA